MTSSEVFTSCDWAHSGRLTCRPRRRWRCFSVPRHFPARFLNNVYVLTIGGGRFGLWLAVARASETHSRQRGSTGPHGKPAGRRQRDGHGPLLPLLGGIGGCAGYGRAIQCSQFPRACMIVGEGAPLVGSAAGVKRHDARCCIETGSVTRRVRDLVGESAARGSAHSALSPWVLWLPLFAKVGGWVSRCRSRCQGAAHW